MKAKTKKLLAAMLAAVMTAAMLLIPASAESIANTAKSRKSGESFSIKLNNFRVYHDYKITLTEKGDLKVKLVSRNKLTKVKLFDSDGNEYEFSKDDSSVSSGDFDGSFGFSGYKYTPRWNELTEQFKGTLVFPGLKKGTYYVRIYADSNTYAQNGKTTVKFTFPGETTEESGSSEAKTSPSLAAAMKAGETLSLAVADADGTVTWTSSKKSVAEVDKNGKVTAKKAGNAEITAETGKTALKIKIVVS